VRHVTCARWPRPRRYTRPTAARRVRPRGPPAPIQPAPEAAAEVRCAARGPDEEGLIADKEEKVELTGEIVEALRNGMFRIALDNGHETLGYTAGKMRRYRIRMNPGDRVRIELSAYDLGRGRIVYRLRPGDERPAAV
jgi:translation initiation factor IF-1